MFSARRPGFTIVELLVVVSIIALLIGILLPAIGKARDQAKTSISQANLRNLGTAHSTYAAEWADRQFTLVHDNISAYGNDVNAFDVYYQSNGGELQAHTHPGPVLGWAYVHGDPANDYLLFHYGTHEGGGEEEHGGSLQAANATLNLPISFGSIMEYFGAFRLGNVKQFYQYVSGKFYDPVFYAPKDTVVWETVAQEGFNGASCWEDPGEYCDRPDVSGLGEIPVWASYVLSPAAMLNPLVMARNDPDDPTFNGWVDPWSLPAGFRSPAMSQALYPNLKTHQLEHHWLQNRQAECNPGFDSATYSDNCEPYYFNHAWESTPVTLFYDGHVGMVGVRDTMRADGRVRAQTGSYGLWSQDTPWGTDGYLSEYGYDQANTSFHILTTDGIRGRDLMAK